MTDQTAHDLDGLTPPAPTLRPEVLARFAAHDREARAYAAAPPQSRRAPDD